MSFTNYDCGSAKKNECKNAPIDAMQTYGKF